ncbi:hypothetical protein GCK72_007766 [Caenorhabditis remanei]|uniref:Uncharacterized protein n=1 Tax=Caenorhabditis remanei TaxID=31234 RepID=A0A6A5HNA2_CAERE|nr:hypothetical protein GCK72_007766 [Caenorhabditis remanei]KAF1767807.1 hypothetical protein GCK72_007766 [Caenorhabditis remanei]
MSTRSEVMAIVAQWVATDFEVKVPASLIKTEKEAYDKFPSDFRQELYDGLKPHCDKFFESESYKNGQTETYGYGICCDVLGMCGMSGWLIFFIILIVLLCLAGAAAAFWFFYYKRKMGGRDEEKEIESTADTATTGHDISVETY